MITGGTSGIGAAFARAFASRGVNLVLVARDAERLEHSAARLRARYGVEVETLAADLADRGDQARVARRLEEPDVGGSSAIDILVNNAGFSVRTELADPDMAQHDRGLEVMQRAVLVLGGAAARAFAAKAGRGAQTAAPGPRAGRAARGGRSAQATGSPSGWIINVCSVSSLITQNNYTAIKAWTLNYSESLSVQTAGTGVQVTALVPGWVHTEFHERAGITGSSIPGILWIEPDKLVRLCLRDVAQGKSVSVPQLRWKLITAGLRVAPRPIIHRLSALLSSRRKNEG